MDDAELYQELAEERRRILDWHRAKHQKEPFSCSCIDMIEQFNNFERRIRNKLKGVDQ